MRVRRSTHASPLMLVGTIRGARRQLASRGAISGGIRPRTVRGLSHLCGSAVLIFCGALGERFAAQNYRLFESRLFEPNLRNVRWPSCCLYSTSSTGPAALVTCLAASMRSLAGHPQLKWKDALPIGTGKVGALGDIVPFEKRRPMGLLNWRGLGKENPRRSRQVIADHSRRGHRLHLEPLERRQMLSVTLATITGPDTGGVYDIPAGNDLYVPLTGTDTGQTISYSATSSNPGVQVSVLTGNPTFEMTVTGTRPAARRLRAR